MSCLITDLLFARLNLCQFCHSCPMAMSFASSVTLWWITVTWGAWNGWSFYFDCSSSPGSICHDRVIHLGTGTRLHPRILLKHQRKVLRIPPGLLVSSGQLICYPQCFLVDLSTKVDGVMVRQFEDRFFFLLRLKDLFSRCLALWDKSQWLRSVVPEKACEFVVRTSSLSACAASPSLELCLCPALWMTSLVRPHHTGERCY